MSYGGNEFGNGYESNLNVSDFDLSGYTPDQWTAEVAQDAYSSSTFSSQLQESQRESKTSLPSLEIADYFNSGSHMNENAMETEERNTSKWEAFEELQEASLRTDNWRSLDLPRQLTTDDLLDRHLTVKQMNQVILGRPVTE